MDPKGIVLTDELKIKLSVAKQSLKRTRANKFSIEYGTEIVAAIMASYNNTIKTEKAGTPETFESKDESDGTPQNYFPPN